MWVRNFDLFCVRQFMPQGVGALPSISSEYGTDGSAKVKDTSGRTYNLAATNDSSYDRPVLLHANSSSSTLGILVGSGTTPATYNDYKLDNRLSLTKVSPVTTVSYNEETKKFVVSITADFLNNTGAAVTVTEVALHGLESYGTSSGSWETFLLSRDLLPEPKTVAAGEYIRITLSYEVGAYPNKPTVTAATV